MLPPDSVRVEHEGETGVGPLFAGDAVEVEILRSLGRTGDGAAVGLLREAARHDHPVISQAAMTSPLGAG